MTDKHIHFKGARSFLTWFEEQRATNGKLGGFYGSPDMNDASTNTGITALRQGNESHLKQARDFMNKITAHTIETPRLVKRKSQAGNYANIPAYLLGQPKNMWRIKREKIERAPLRIWVGMTSSAMIDEEDLIKRGAALAAFAMAMAPTRKIIITPFVCLGSYSSRRSVRNMLISWDISTSPLVLSELMNLTMPEVVRFVGIEACQHLFGTIASGDGGFHHDAWDEAKMRVHLGAKSTDLYLPSLYGRDPIIKDPVKWVNENVTRFISGEATDFKVKPTDTF